MKADRISKLVDNAAVQNITLNLGSRVVSVANCKALLRREQAYQRARVRRIIRSETWVNIADLLAMIDGTYKRVSTVKKLKPDKPSTQWLGPQVSRNRRTK